MVPRDICTELPDPECPFLAVGLASTLVAGKLALIQLSANLLAAPAIYNKGAG